MKPTIQGAVEGLVDEAVLRRIVEHSGATAGTVYGKNGKDSLLKKLSGYNRAAQFTRWAVLVDLDQEPCVVEACKLWLPDPSHYMCFRIAVREVESWLLADTEQIAQFLKVSTANIPRDPESLQNPKRSMVDIARKSRSKDIQADMVPRPLSGREVGPAYASRMVEFAEYFWRPDQAAANSDSLDRCLRCLQKLIETKLDS
jgi:hypothetical protein